MCVGPVGSKFHISALPNKLMKIGGIKNQRKLAKMTEKNKSQQSHRPVCLQPL